MLRGTVLGSTGCKWGLTAAVAPWSPMPAAHVERAEHRQGSPVDAHHSPGACIAGHATVPARQPITSTGTFQVQKGTALMGYTPCLNFDPPVLQQGHRGD